tara:strand:+ start:1593 stop:2375 length:783 start_codon:yes stop_codon:yes gene_type:complete
MWGLFGLDAKSQAEREVTDLTGGRKDFKDWNIGDRFRSAITGVSKEDILKRAQDIAANNINQNNSVLIGDTRRSLGGTGLEANSPLSIQLGDTEADFQQKLTDDFGRGTAANNYLALDGSDPTKIKADSQVGDLITLAGGARKNERERVRTEQKQDIAATRAHSDGQLATQLQAGRDQYNHSFKTQEARLAHTDKQNRLDRSLERDLANSSSDLQMQMKFMDMDLADKRMAYDRETRKMDKRDRMIAQLMQSLGQLGGAF